MDPPVVWEIAFLGVGIRGYRGMNKTDVRNPAQHATYLQAYVSQKGKDKLMRAGTMME